MGADRKMERHPEVGHLQHKQASNWVPVSSSPDIDAQRDAARSAPRFLVRYNQQTWGSHLCAPFPRAFPAVLVQHHHSRVHNSKGPQPRPIWHTHPPRRRPRASLGLGPLGCSGMPIWTMIPSP